MTKSFKALVAGLCSLAVLATGCTDKPAPEVPSAEAAVVSAEATTATIKLTTKLISEYAYVVRTDATQADDAAIIFLEGTTGTIADGETQITLDGLRGQTNYVVKFAFRVSETEFYDQIVAVEFTTTDYTDNVTILGLYNDGFAVHYKVPQEVKERGNAIRYNFGTLPMYLTQKKGWRSVPDADILLMNGQKHFVGDTTMEFTSKNLYMVDDEGNYVLDKWTGEPITLHTPYTPGEPLVLMAGEFTYDTENITGWGNGWYTPMFDTDGYYEELWGSGEGGWGPLAVEVDDEGSSEDKFWNGWFSRKHITLPQPTELDCNLDIKLDIGSKKGTITFTPDENILRYCVFITPEYEYEMVLEYLDNNPDYLQWFTASFPGYAYFGAMTFEGNTITELALEDYFYLEPETTYHLFVTALGDEMGATQKFYSQTFTTLGKTLPAPEVEVKAISNPSGTESPYEVWFNVKCTNKNAVSGKYAANYESEWGKLLNFGMNYNDIVNSGNNLSAADIAKINSDEGMDMMFSSLPDMTTLLGIVLQNEEETYNVIDLGSGLASATTIKEPAKTPVSSSLFTDLLGTWTMSAQTAVFDGSDFVDGGERKCKVTIAEGFTLPETLADSVYTIYHDAIGMGKDAVDALYDDLKEEVAAYNAKLKSQNRLLCTGFGFESTKSDALQYYTLKTPYDLFVSKDYNGYDNRSIIFDCGPKWFLEVFEDGSLGVPINDAHEYPLSLAQYYTMYLAAVGAEGYITRLVGDEDCVFPCEVASDKNSFVIKPFMYNDNPFYLTGVYSYYGMIYPTDFKIVSEIKFTKGWTEETSIQRTATKSMSATRTIESKSAGTAEFVGSAAAMRRTPMPDNAPARQKASYKRVKVEDAVTRMMKAYGYERQ